MASSAARSMEASSVNSYLRKIHGAISCTGESARRAQARPGQHLGRADTELRRCRDGGGQGQSSANALCLVVKVLTGDVLEKVNDGRAGEFGKPAIRIGPLSLVERSSGELSRDLT